jgi:hypothetical protein
MTLRSKIIPVALAAFCGLALQLQASGAYAYNPLMPGQSLFLGQAMRTYGGYMLFLQQDGNLVLYSPSNTPLWSVTSTYGSRPIALTLDVLACNLIIYGYPTGSTTVQQLWSSQTNLGIINSNGPCLLDLEENGSLSLDYIFVSGSVTLFAGQ